MIGKQQLFELACPGVAPPLLQSVSQIRIYAQTTETITGCITVLVIHMGN